MNKLLLNRLKERETDFKWIKQLIYKVNKKLITESNAKELIANHIILMKEKNDSPFYIGNIKFRKYIECLDEYYSENKDTLDPNNKWLIIDLCNSKNMSISLLSISFICNIINSASKDLHISKTNAKICLARALLSVSEYSKKSKKNTITYASSELNDLVALGEFLYQGLIDTGILVQDDKYMVLSDNASEILRVVKSLNMTHPSIYEFDTYIPNKTYYNFYSSSYQMVHLNDSSGLRKSSLNLGENSYKSANYLQSVPFYIQTDEISKIKSNILEEFIIYSEEDMPLSLRFCNETELVEYQKNNSDTIDLYSFKKMWRISNSKLDSFILLITIADAYSYAKLFFRVYYDWRGRLYYSGFLNPQGCSLCRRLLCFDTRRQIQSYDVCASGFQILALINNCERTLKMTKFFDSEMEDLYEYNLKMFLKAIEKDTELMIFIPILNRKFYKMLIMCRAYSESDFSRCIKIQKEYFEYSGINVSFNLAMNLSKLFVSVYKEENPVLNEFENDIMELIDEISKKENFIYIGCDDKFLESVSVYPKQESLLISYKHFKTKKMTRVTLKMDKIPLVNNKSKQKKSIIPNLIHNIDATLLNMTVIRCRELNIKLYVVHDCFYVDPIHGDTIKNIYYKSAITLFKENPMIKFMKMNNVVNEKMEEKYIQYTKSFQESLNRLVMSNDILR